METMVKDVMTTRVIWVKKDATFREMAAALRKHRVSAFPVIDDDGTVVGVVSEADMLTKAAMADPGVLDGLGSPETAALGHHIIGKVRHVQGVVAVRDRLSYPDVYPIVAGPVP